MPFGARLPTEWDVKRRIAHKKEIAKLAQFCEEAFKQSVLNGARKSAPSTMEIEALKTGRPIICRFYFLDSNVKAIGINSYTTAAQAIKDLAKRIDLPDTTGWSIYEVNGERGMNQERLANEAEDGAISSRCSL